MVKFVLLQAPQASGSCSSDATGYSYHLNSRRGHSGQEDYIPLPLLLFMALDVALEAYPDDAELFDPTTTNPLDDLLPPPPPPTPLEIPS